MTKTLQTSHKAATTYQALQKDFGYTSAMQAPRLQKIVISVGVSPSVDKKRREIIVDRLAKITGQQPAERPAKKSIASFKLREGDIVGYQVTLRGNRMRAFLDKLVHIVFPRVRDFRGVKPAIIDEMGNATVGFKEHTVFPETADEDVRDVFGLAVTLTTSAKTKQEAEAFLRHLGFPLRT